MSEQVDWQAIDDYAQVLWLAGEMPDLPLPDFLAGPLARLIAMAQDSSAGPRVRARVMECARALWLTRNPCSDDHAAAASFVSQRLSGVEDEDYLLEVWDGHATHNYGASTSRSERG